MLRLSVNEMTTYRWSFEDDVTSYAAAGISQMGVWRQKISDYGDDAGIDLIHENGMSVSSLTWAGGFTGSDGRSHEESIRDGLEAIELAAKLEADSLIVYTGGRGGHTRSHARRLVKSALHELAWLADDFGVTLALEPMHPGCGLDWTFLTGLDATLDLLAEVNRDCVKLLLDTYHLGFDPALRSRLAEFVSQIGLVHLGDARRVPLGEQDRCLLGRGRIPVQEIVTTLQEYGYEGAYELELMGQEIEDYDYWELLSDSQRVVEEFLGAGIS